MVRVAEVSKESDELWNAVDKAQAELRRYFETRDMSDHSIRGMQQAISNAVDHISIAAKGGVPDWTHEEYNSASYLASLVLEMEDNPRISVKRKAECKFALELLADALNVKDEMVKKISTQRHVYQR